MGEVYRAKDSRLGREVAISLLAMVMFYPDSGSVPGYIVGFCFGLAVFWLVLF